MKVLVFLALCTSAVLAGDWPAYQTQTQWAAAPVIVQQVPQVYIKEVPRVIVKEVPRVIVKEVPRVVVKNVPVYVTKEVRVPVYIRSAPSTNVRSRSGSNGWGASTRYESVPYTVQSVSRGYQQPQRRAGGW